MTTTRVGLKAATMTTTTTTASKVASFSTLSAARNRKGNVGSPRAAFTESNPTKFPNASGENCCRRTLTTTASTAAPLNDAPPAALNVEFPTATLKYCKERKSGTGTTSAKTLTTSTKKPNGKGE